MKKIVSLIVVLCMVITMLCACSDANGQVKEDANQVAFVENSGLFEASDVSDNVPIDGAGFKIEVKKASDGYAKFVITGKDGKETVDYYKFDFATGEVEKYHYVAMMGVGFYYYYDMEKSELVRLEDDGHKDTTQSSKDSGRWDGAAEDTANEIKSIEDYFTKTFSMSIEEYVAK